jgi:cation-transporting ATPase 13A3/4/5
VLRNLVHLCAEKKTIKYFTCKKCTYIWNEEARKFYRLGGLSSATNTELLSSSGLGKKEQENRRSVFGPNLIHIHMKSVVQLLFAEVLNPFYVFQLFSVCLWYSDEYYYYASAIVVMSAFGITSAIVQTRQVS